MSLEEAIESQLNEIFNLVEAIDCLRLHLTFLRSDFQEKTEFQKNKVRLEEIKTNLSILRIKRLLKRNFKEFEESIIIYEYALKECNDE
jgi:hypothetical protein